MTASGPSPQPALDNATLRDWIEKRATATPDATALLTRSGPLDFTTFHRRATTLANVFSNLGLGRGDVIAAQLPNDVEFVLTFLAAGYIGAIFQTVHMPYRAGEIEPLLLHSKAKALVCLGRVKDFSPAEFVLSRRSALPSLQHVIVVGDESIADTHAFPDAATLPDGKDIGRPVATDLFQLLYTSGTTAAPKGVTVAENKFLPNPAL